MTKSTARTEVALDLSDEDVLELLPWYAGGKTTAEETAAIERKLAANPKMQAELALVRREKQVAVESMKEIGEPGPEFLQKMLGQLDSVRQLPPLRREAGEAAPGLLARLFGFAPTPALRFAMVAACLLIVAESAALLKLTSGSEEPAYQTASAPVALGPQLIVRFQPDAKMSAITMLLSDLSATVVKGPMPDGAFVIALQQGANPADAITVLNGHGDLVAGVEQGS